MKNNRSRLLFSAAIAAIVAVVISGCGILYQPKHQESNNGRGQSSSDIESQLNADGVTSKFIYKDYWIGGEGGLGSTKGIYFDLEVVIDEGYKIENHTEFLKFLLAEAWSANQTSPDETVYVDIEGGYDLSFDWQASIDSIFGEDSGIEPIEYSSMLVAAPVEDMTRVFGVWAGNPPTESITDFIIKGEPTPLSGSPVDGNLFLVYINNGSDYSVIGSVLSNIADERYTGDITVTLFDSDVDVYTHTYTVDDQECSTEKCLFWTIDIEYKLNTQPDVSKYTYQIDFAPQEGFDTTSITG